MEKISVAVRFRPTAPASSDDSCTSGGDREWCIGDTRISLLHRATPVPGASFAYKAAKLRDLQAQVLHNHHSRTYTKEALGLSFKLLKINPEAYTAWNYRKLAFQHNLGELSDPEAIKSTVDDVLRVVGRGNCEKKDGERIRRGLEINLEDEKVQRNPVDELTPKKLTL